MLPSWTTLPLKWIPQPVTAVSLGIVLNLFFKRYPELKKRLAELNGKIFQFEVEDLGESFYMTVDDGGDVRIHGYSDSIPHVTMSGSSGAFLSLLFSTRDPDSLFFSRQLKLSGETDTGLAFKNLLDNVDIDWERELTVLVGATAAKALVAMAEQAREFGEQSREKVEREFEQWMDERKIPRKSQLERFQKEVERLAKGVETLERGVTRVERKSTLAGKS